MHSRRPPNVRSDAPGGADRRAFLQRFAGAVTCAASTPLGAVAVSGDLYVNHRLGLAFRRPKGWRYEHLSTFADIRNEYEYATMDVQMQASLTNGPLPVVVASQASLLRSLGASITVFVEESPLSPGETLGSIAPELVRFPSLYVKAFRLLQAPVLGDVSGCEAIEYLFSFLYEDRLGNRGPVRHRTLGLRRANLLYTFNMLDVPADRIDAQAEFDSVRASIVIA